MSKLGVNTKLNTKVDLSKVDSHNQSSTSSSATTTTTDNSDRSDKSNTNIGTGDHSSRTHNRSEIRSDSNEVKHDLRYSDSSTNYNMASGSAVYIQSPHGAPGQFVSPQQLPVQSPMSSNQGAITSESTNTGLFGIFGALLSKKKPVVDAPFDESLDRPQIIESNMSEDMQDEVVGVLYYAHGKLENTKDRGIFIRDKLNNKYSHEWHCIIGTELDGCCMGQDGHYMQLKYKGHTYVIFKTPSPQLQVELIKKVDILTQNIEDLNTNLNEYMEKEKNQDKKIEEIQKENQNLLTEKNDVENKNSELIDENTNLSAQNESMKKELEEAKTILKLRNEEIVDTYRKRWDIEDDKKKIMTEACKKGDIEVVRALLDLGYFGANDRVDGSLSGLHWTAAYNHANVVSLLLDRGTDVNLRRTDSDGWTPLMYAAYYGCLESAQVLLTRGADKYLRSTDWSKRTALRIARDTSHGDRKKMIDYLVSFGVPE